MEIVIQRVGQEQHGDADELEDRLELAGALGGEDDALAGGDEAQAGDEELARHDDEHEKDRPVGQDGGLQAGAGKVVAGHFDEHGDEQADDEDLVGQGVHEFAEIGDLAVTAGEEAVEPVRHPADDKEDEGGGIRPLEAGKQQLHHDEERGDAGERDEVGKIHRRWNRAERAGTGGGDGANRLASGSGDEEFTPVTAGLASRFVGLVCMITQSLRP